MPKWTILLVSVEERRSLLHSMITELLRQAEPFDGDVTVLAYVDNFDVPRYSARQLLLDRAEGDYICFVDDDDEVAKDYVARIYAELGEVDYVGFRLQCFWDGAKLKPTFHSLRYQGWTEDDAGFYRAISHLNPVRRELVADVAFPPFWNEDCEWAKAVTETGRLRTEAFIDAEMYRYHYDSHRTLTHEENRTYRPQHVALPQSPLVRYLTAADVEVVA